MSLSCFRLILCLIIYPNLKQIYSATVLFYVIELSTLRTCSFQTCLLACIHPEVYMAEHIYFTWVHHYSLAKDPPVLYCILRCTRYTINKRINKKTSAIFCVLSVVPLFEFFLSDFDVKSILYIPRTIPQPLKKRTLVTLWSLSGLATPVRT